MDQKRKKSFIKMIHNGAWVLIVKREQAYADAAECNKHNFKKDMGNEINSFGDNLSNGCDAGGGDRLGPRGGGGY
jgi:hypothetical protein